jgi:fimbrial chaperone protein
MLWPLDPVIESQDRATALWIENRGTSPTTVQIRVLRWDVREHADYYTDQQSEVIASPPFATIEPGRRQLVRLMKLQAAPPGREAAYRVLVDEVSPPAPASGTTSVGITFRMRYSLPLFVYGQGLSAADRPKWLRVLPDLEAPALAWRIVADGGGRWLQVRNLAPVHARLTKVRLVGPDVVVNVADGLLGYTLPGTEMRWPLPPGAPEGDGISLEANVSSQVPMTIARY